MVQEASPQSETNISPEARRNTLERLIADKLQNGYWIESQDDTHAVLVLAGRRGWRGRRGENHREAVSVDVDGVTDVLVLPKRRY
jgi:hypothetical protein